MGRYPSEAELKRIKFFEIKSQDDCVTLAEFIVSIWEYDDYAKIVEQGPAKFLTLSTGGWSGNEEIMQALHTNFMFTAMTECRDRRGGHYTIAINAPAKKMMEVVRAVDFFDIYGAAQNIPECRSLWGIDEKALEIKLER